MEDPKISRTNQSIPVALFINILLLLGINNYLKIVNDYVTVCAYIFSYNSFLLGFWG